MRIFLTGASGFVGRYFLLESLSRGHDIICLSRSKIDFVPPSLTSNLSVFQFDLESLCESTFPEVDLIVHLAASGVSYLEAPWSELFTVNILGTKLIATIAASKSIPIIITGSSKEYGSTVLNYDFIPPNAPLLPLTPHAVSKTCAYLVAQSISNSCSNTLIYLRLFNVYGDGQNIVSLWPSLKSHASAGNNFSLNASSNVRDFMDINLAALGISNFVDHIHEFTGTQTTFNLASGSGKTIGEFCSEWWSYWNATGTLISSDRSPRSDDYPRVVADISSLPAWTFLPIR